MTEGALTGFLTNVGSIFTTVIGWMATIASTVASDPILLTFTVVALIFLGVNMYRRLLNL